MKSKLRRIDHSPAWFEQHQHLTYIHLFRRGPSGEMRHRSSATHARRPVSGHGPHLEREALPIHYVFRKWKANPPLAAMSQRSIRARNIRRTCYEITPTFLQGGQFSGN